MPRVNRPTSRLAHGLERRQVEAVLRADRAAAHADRVARQIWSALLDAIRKAAGPRQAFINVSRLLAELLPRVREAVRTGLERIARWGHEASVKNLLAELPRNYLRRIAGESGNVRKTHLENRAVDFGLGLSGGMVGRLAQHQVGLEVLHAGKNSAQLTEQEEEGPLSRFSDAGLRRLVNELTFPPPTQAELQALVGRGWQATLVGGLPDTNQLAGVVLNGFTQGKSLRQIAEDLRPHVDGVAYRARTIARTEGLNIANATQKRAWDQAGDIVAGFQIHSVGDERVRPEHAARDGRTWYKDSGEDMQTALQMELPVLPDAWNCRCYLTPILSL